MFSLLLLEKDGTITEKKVKSFDKLYSLCHYRTEGDFELLNEWTKLSQSYILYGKRKGNKNNENKNVFPFPLNETKMYGTLCLLKKIDGCEDSVSIEEWNNFKESFHKEETYSDEKELKKEEYEEE